MKSLDSVMSVTKLRNPFFLKRILHKNWKDSLVVGLSYGLYLESVNSNPKSMMQAISTFIICMPTVWV